MGVRDLLPSLLLRLGRDQDCYDFVKWCAQDRTDYDWDDMDLPFLDIKDADLLEDVNIFIGRDFATCQTVAIMLIKIRLLMELRTLKASELISEKVPKEILDNVQDQLLSHSLKNHPSKKKILDSNDEYEDCKGELKHQIVQTHKAIRGTNRYFWPALLKPGRHLTAPPSAYSSGSVQEMQIYLQYSYDAWVETPGAIDIVKQLEEDDFMDSDDDVYEHDSEIHSA